MEPFRKILIATDGSRSTEDAVDTGISIAKITGAEVTALNVIDGPVLLSAPADAEMVKLYALLEMEGNAAVAHIKELGMNAGIKVTAKVMSGQPAKAILEEGEKHDLIVMGTLGRTGMAKILIGSVAEKVIRLAKCPVMVVRSRGDDQ